MKITRNQIRKILKEFTVPNNPVQINDTDELLLRIAMKIKDMMPASEALGMSDNDFEDLMVSVYEQNFDPEGEGWAPYPDDVEDVQNHLTIKEAVDHYEFRHQEDQKDLEDHRADVVFEIIEAQQGISGKEIVDVALRNSVFGGSSSKEVYETLDALVHFQDVVFNEEEDAWYILGSPESQSFINEFFSKKKDPEEYHQAFLDAGYTERNIRAAIPNLAKSLSDNKVDLNDVAIVIKKLLQSPKDHIAGIPGAKAIYKELRKMGSVK